jgi:hypothetical protein
MFARGSAAGNSSAANGAIAKSNLGFYRGISARIKNFARVYVNNACIHESVPLKSQNYK